MVGMASILNANIRKLDIGTLIALQRLLDEGNLSKVAREIGLSQPALSHVLARLRNALGDPLLVREGGGLTPTPRGVELRDRLHQLMPQMEAVFAADGFDPAQSDMLFKIALTDHAGEVLLARLLDAQLSQAPRVKTTIAVIPNRQTDLAALDEGHYDLRIGWLRSLPPQWHRRKLLEDRIVLIAARDNDAVLPALSVAQFAQLGHVALESERPIYPNMIDSFLAEHNLERNVIVRVSHFSLAPSIVASSKLVAMFPERLARRFGDSIRIVDPPLPFPNPNLSMAWHPRTHDSLAHRWLRGLVVSTCQTLA